MALIELATRSVKQTELRGPIRKWIIEFLEATTIAELAEKVMPDRKERNHQREEEALYPRLEKHNIVEPVEIMKLEHLEFRGKKKEEVDKLKPDDRSNYL